MVSTKHDQYRSDVVIAHSVSSWLPPTQTWVFNQIKWQTQYENIVLAGSNNDNFPQLCRLFIFNSLPQLQYLTNRIIRKMTGINRYYDTALSTFNKVLLLSHFGTVGWEDAHLKNKQWHVTRFYGYDIDMLPNTQPRWKERYKRLFEKCEAFLIEGPCMKQHLVERGCPSHKIHIHQLGTDVDRIPYRNREIQGQLKVLLASRFVEKKGLVYAVEGIAKAYHDLHCREMAVTIIGDSTGTEEDERYKDALLQTIKTNNIGHIISFLGDQKYDDMIRIALDHNVFLHPSVTARNGDSEGGYPVVLLDMMASGMPVVSTRHCDIPQVVSDRRFGVLCRERNSDDIAQSLYQILNGTLVFDSRTISDSVRVNHNWRKSGQALTAILEEVMRSH